MATPTLGAKTRQEAQGSDRGDYEPSWRLEPYALEGQSEYNLLHLATVLVSDDDRTPNARPGQRFHQLFDQRCERLGRRGARRQLAIDYGDCNVSYAELAAGANSTAYLLDILGIRAGDRVALLFDTSAISASTVLALSKLGATYVPLDAGFPDDRIGYILEDSEADVVLTLDRFASRFRRHGIPVFALDKLDRLRELLPATTFEASPADDDPISYIIYTSGTTGRPKGVPVRHSSICNFLSVTADLYGYSERDRVYQGMTIAFDFSVEELWVPLVAGATLVPAPADTQLVGEDLHDFLRYNHVTAMCCVPTLLATVPPDLPELSFLLVSGEACPADVIEPWLTANRRVLNAYGPTETTVTATWSVVENGCEVTIGGPLPTYSVLILDPDEPRPLATGAKGEICIAGVGLADGYLNRPTETAQAFIHDFIGLDNNPGGKIYRTGDLGRINADKHIEYLGRIDTQVKIRGYRIELDEIAAVARECAGVGTAVVDAYDPESGGTELVAYLTAATPGTTLDMGEIHTALRNRLPAYMVPSYYEQLDALPLLPSTKVDRGALPPPTRGRLIISGRPHVEPRTELESQLAALVAIELGVDGISVEADFFEELGADSLKLAGFATRIRAELGIKRVSMKRLYQNPSVGQLAASIEPATSPVVAQHEKGDELPSPIPSSSAAPSPGEPVLTSFTGPSERDGRTHQPSMLAYAGTGVAQALVFVTATFVVAVCSFAVFQWIGASADLISAYRRSAVGVTALFFGGSATLIGVKWAAVGRFTAEPVPLWTWRYVRFWIAKRAIQINPLNVLNGTPMYNVFLRSIGMEVGRQAVIMARAPVCVDLVSVGQQTIVREDCHMPAYTAHNGYLYPGPITIGHSAVVGEATVLDIGTVIEDEAQLGTSSSLLEGQRVPAGQVYQGSPAIPSASNFDRLPALAVSRRQRAGYTLGQLLSLCLVTLPSSFLVAYGLGRLGLSSSAISPWSGLFGGLVTAAIVALVVYVGGLVVALITVTVVPRALNQFVVAERPHPLYGFQYRLARGIRAYSNNIVLNTIFGDSSMIVGYLKRVGYDLSRSTQTGSNFGVDQRHHSPFLCSFDRNTLVSDGLRMLNMEISATSFQLRQIHMPPDTYIGNLVHYPAGSRVGADCLIATKAAVPIDGPPRTGVGILGSPAFEIPRSVTRDQRFDHLKAPSVLQERLRLKLRSNLGTLALYLLRTWFLIIISVVLLQSSFALADPAGSNAVSRGALALTLSAALSVVATPICSILMERLVRRFRPLTPLYCSLYDPRFWNHERFWKLNYNALLRVFDGTPMKPSLVRLQGAKIGKRAFDDGSGFTEPTLVEIGDDAMLNFGSTIQCHSLEDGTFKSDRVLVGDTCTLEVGAFVHYGTTLGDGSVLKADSFLMKGSDMTAQSHWLGNPARQLDRTPTETSHPAEGMKEASK